MGPGRFVLRGGRGDGEARNGRPLSSRRPTSSKSSTNDLISRGGRTRAGRGGEVVVLRLRPPRASLLAPLTSPKGGVSLRQNAADEIESVGTHSDVEGIFRDPAFLFGFFTGQKN